MKRSFLIGITMLLGLQSFAQQDPVLLEIKGKKVTKSEFLQIYLKNNANPKYDKASLDEYMELFKKFQLKVAEAESMGYDTIPKLKKELEGYQKQLALPYLIDSAKNESLVKQAYDRTLNEVRAAHILVKIDLNANPEDTLKAYQKIMDMRSRILKGESFDQVAKSGSEDPSAKMNGGDLGFFSAFQMVYPFEEAAYTTPLNEVSMPFRTRFGYHILKVTDKRTTRGTIQTAHIMIAVKKDAALDEVETAEKKINEIYDELVKGGNFDQLAESFSDDPSSSNKGGVLPAFGTGTTTRMVSSFEEAAFALQKDGDISKPIRTDYGFHIIKRIKLDPIKPFELMKKELQGKVNKDERSKKTQDSFVAKLKVNYGYTNLTEKNMKWFLKNLDTNYFVGKWDANKLTTDKPLFTIGDKSFTQKQFANYLVANYRAVKKDDPKNVINLQYKNWEKEQILAYEETKLMAKYPEYKALMSEYHDGILLYEIMSDKVWNKAIKDTVGIKEFFNTNRSNYTWSDRIDAVVYECASEKIAQEVTKMLKIDTMNSKYVIEKINKDSELNLKVKTNKFELKNINYLKDRSFVKGLNKYYAFEGKYYVIKVSEVLAPQNKEFNEAKGAITSDYQNYLEKTWLEELNKKYPITIHQDVLYSIGK
jgi:peptidyl-prolyl cis-trans isomerase SurA